MLTGGVGVSPTTTLRGWGSRPANTEVLIQQNRDYLPILVVGGRRRCPRNATFKITSWDEEPFDEPENGPKLTRAHVRRSFHGDLSGTGNLMYLMTHLDTGASFIGLEKVVGSLAGGKAASCCGTPASTMEKRPRRSTRSSQGPAQTSWSGFRAPAASPPDMPRSTT